MKAITVFHIVLCFVLGDVVAALTSEEITEITETCCAHGENFAITAASAKACAGASLPDDIEPEQKATCVAAVGSCCEQQFQQKDECAAGLKFAPKKRCNSAKGDIGKTCCEECTFGRWTGESQGKDACGGPSEGDVSPTTAMRKNAFYQCCLEAAAELETTTAKKIETTTQKKIETTTQKKEVKKDKCKPGSCEQLCNDDDGISCQCFPGHRLQADNKSCKDINECAESDDDLCPVEGTVCHNTVGSYKCVPIKKRDVSLSCPPGFKRNVLNQVCDDINECQLPRPPCPKYLCENTIGGYKCGGKPGKPFEEAVPGVTTEPVISTTVAAKNDICPSGFRAGPDDECIDIDECEERLDDCQRLSQYCINTHGSFFCQDHVSKRCAPGFKVNSISGKCEDIDECEDGSEVCKRTEVCVNLPGAYNCKSKISTLPKLASKNCQEGTRMRPGGSVCEDIDECREGTHLCDQFQNCINTFGGHECRCKNGFELDSSSGSCTDIDECALKLDNCEPGTHCLNVLGTFTCTRRAPTSTTVTTTTAAPPLYEYEYYDSEEDNGTVYPDPIPPKYPASIPTPKPTTTSTTTTTPKPTSTTSAPTRRPYPRRRPERPRYLRPTTSTTTEVPTTTTEIPSPPTNYDPYSRRPDRGRTTPRRPETPISPEVPTPTASTDPRRPDPRTPDRPESSPPSYYPRRPDSRPPGRPGIIEPERPTATPSTPYDRPRRPDPRQPERPDSYPERPTSPTNYDRPRRPDNEIPPSETPRRPDSRYPGRPEYNPPRSTVPTYDPYNRRPDSRPPSRPDNPRYPVEVTVDPPKSTVTYEVPKDPEGGYELNTSDIPKDTWTNVIGKEKPDFDVNQLHCLDGYERNERGECVDINECERGNTCSSLEVCKNLPGGHTCECMPGFHRDASGNWCVVDTTSTSSSTTTTTSTTTESTTAVATSPEWPYTPREPSRPRGRPYRPAVNCELGYTFDNNLGKCVDINECTTNRATCSPDEDCVNIDGGYRCVCGRRCHKPDTSRPTHTIGDGSHWEPPITDSNVITVGAQYGQRGPRYMRPTYTRLPNSISSSCPWGYKLTPEKRCLDIDECAKNTTECGPDQRCENFYGGYSCQCPAGHKLAGQSGCEDIDECQYGNPCSYNSECINTVGSYRCNCGSGFRNAASNDKVCVDIDECSETPSVCEQACSNVWGGYRCYCNRGYRLHEDNRTCVDVDECAEWSLVRSRGRICGGQCVNEPGSYRCTCPQGYRLSEDNRSCIDIDECESGEATCARNPDPGEVCQNTRGSYHCHRIDCPTGYKLEGKHRCTRVQRSCPINDWTCLQKPSTYSYHFITFVANIYLPSGSVDLFTMHGPGWREAVVSFEMRMMSVQAAPGVQPADFRCFDMRPSGNICVVSLLCSLEGPQVAELELTMSLYQYGQFAGSAVARLILLVSQYDY